MSIFSDILSTRAHKRGWLGPNSSNNASPQDPTISDVNSVAVKALPNLSNVNLSFSSKAQFQEFKIQKACLGKNYAFTINLAVPCNLTTDAEQRPYAESILDQFIGDFTKQNTSGKITPGENFRVEFVKEGYNVFKSDPAAPSTSATADLEVKTSAAKIISEAMQFGKDSGTLAASTASLPSSSKKPTPAPSSPKTSLDDVDDRDFDQVNQDLTSQYRSQDIKTILWGLSTKNKDQTSIIPQVLTWSTSNNGELQEAI